MRRLLVVGALAAALVSAISASQAAKSPSSGLIAYEHLGNLYVVKPNGSGRLRITDNSETDYVDGWPSWSPDGRRIAFYREETHGIATINPDGTDRRFLTDNRGSDVRDASPAWSSTGGIAFTRYDPNETPRGWRVMVMNADGSKLRALPFTHLKSIDELAWSPDGRRLTFAAFGPRRVYQLWVMRSDGTKVRRLTRAPYEDTEPAWSPNGRWILFTRFHRPPGGVDLWIVHPNGSRLHRFRSDNPVPDDDPAWSPDGRRIVFDSCRRLTLCGDELMTMRANGKGKRRPLRPRVIGLNAAWQPGPSGT